MAPAFLATAALDVETEAARLVAQGPGFAGVGKDLANLVEDADVGGRVAAGRAADRRLVDLDDLVDLAGPAKARVRARLGAMPPSRRTRARASVSFKSELLPEPLTPVTQTSAERGNRAVTPLRLFVVTPSM